MFKLFRRTHYLIHPSSQLKYIEMAVIPALLLSFICGFFLITSGDIFLMKQKARIFDEIASLQELSQRLSLPGQGQNPGQTLGVLDKRLAILQNNMEMEYFYMVGQWAKTKMMLSVLLAIGLLFSGFMALLFSHRVAGPICRLKKIAEMFTQGKDIPPVKFRTQDEFKELADIFEKLRVFLKSKGVLK